MRTFLILVLSLALLAAAFATRPGKREFVLHLLDSSGSGSGWNGGAVDSADRFARSVAFRDRWLWTDVEKDGKVIYTGLFAHWVPRGVTLEKSVPSTSDLAKLIAHAK